MNLGGYPLPPKFRANNNPLKCCVQLLFCIWIDSKKSVVYMDTVFLHILCVLYVLHRLCTIGSAIFIAGLPPNVNTRRMLNECILASSITY